MASNYNICDFGATGDGTTLDHVAIQRAIEAAHVAGGGTVCVPAGAYRCGTIELRSRIRLDLALGATIIGSSDPADYRPLFKRESLLPISSDYDIPVNTDQHLIVASGADDVALTGFGTVDARGHAFYDTSIERMGGRPNYACKKWRPGATIAFVGCRRVNVQDISVRDNPFFAIFLYGSQDVWIRGVNIDTDRRFHNADGIHGKGSGQIRISGCRINAEDDAICFYHDNWGFLDDRAKPCTGMIVSDCHLAAACCGVRIGYAGDGDLGEMVFNNLVIAEANRAIDFQCASKSIFSQRNCGCGPTIRDCLFSNIIATSAWGITANVLPEAMSPAGLQDLRFDGMHLRSTRGNYLIGTKAVPIKDVMFRDVIFDITGPMDNPVAAVPDPLNLFGGANIPYGMFLRHARDIRFRDTSIRWRGASGKWRGGLGVEECQRVETEPMGAGLRQAQYPNTKKSRQKND